MNRQDQIYYAIALQSVPTIGDASIRMLLNHYKDFKKVFDATFKDLVDLGIQPSKAKAIKTFQDFKNVESALKSLNKNSIEIVLINENSFPNRLLLNDYTPSILFYKGNIDFNNLKMISIVGTRTNTEYGKESVQNLVSNLRTHQPTIVSGLAYGIDIIAHRAALENELPTIAVLAHGLDEIYPSNHSRWVPQIMENGGLVSSFLPETKIHPSNFPDRNRIIAALCDALVVVESGVKGGSMITAQLANDFNKDVFAFPGRTLDTKSSGCNMLIKSNRANLIESSKDIEYILGWDKAKTKSTPTIQNLFLELSTEENEVINMIKKEGEIHYDKLAMDLPYSISQISSTLITLELKGVLKALPGRMYRLIM